MVNGGTRRQWRAASARLVWATLVVLMLGGCGDGDATSTTTSSGAAARTTDPGTTIATSTSSATSTATSSTTSTSAPVSSTTLPGEEIFSYAADGDILGVMGVAGDDMLNVRAVPGTDAEVVATLAPTAGGARATGRARKMPRSIWYEIVVEDVTGWANSSNLGFRGATDDATAEFLDGGDPPERETVEAIGELVAEDFTPDVTEPGLRIVQSVPASVGDVARIGYDVIGIADDSVAGFRLDILATPTDDEQGYVLRSIERTLFCWRGVSDGVCV